MGGGRILLSSALLLLLIGGAASGADHPPQGRVGGIDVAEGGVGIRLPAEARAGGESRPGAWSEAERNDPVAAGMAVRTEAAARAVLRVGADLIAFAGASEADIVELDEGGTTIALRRGRLGLRLSAFDAGRAVEVTIPGGTLRLAAPGRYDILAGDGKLPARIVALAGEARFSGEGRDAVVGSGGAVLLSGGDPAAMLPGGTDADEFAEWWEGQKHDAADAPVLSHVSAAITGHEALDGHGVWESVADIGEVWFPTDAPRDWVPYRFGHWLWLRPWGWTWIDDMQWGFATSHFGRWAYVGGSDGEAGRWGWVPGRRVDEPAFMPAAVAFLGTAGVGLSYPDAFSPAVAWFPLAPGEVYWPSFTDDPDAIRRLNADAVADLAAIGAALKGDPPAEIVTGDYRNRRYASVVPRAVFVGGKPVADAVISLPLRRLENAPLLAGSPGIKPPSASPPAATAVASNGGAAAAKLAKARDTLAIILKGRDRGKRAVEVVVLRAAAPKKLAVEKHDAKPQAARKHEKGRLRQAVAPARSSGASKTRLRKAERTVKPAKRHTAELHRAEAGG